MWPPILANSFGVGSCSQQLTTEKLSDDILLYIFRRCLDVTPRLWPTLAWVSHRWRQIVLTSPLGLNLRLHCTHGTPVLEALNCWTALPIVVLYGGAPNLEPPATEDDDSIIAALKQSDRVSSISLTITRSLIKKLSTISQPILGLEELSLLSHDGLQLTLPSTFRWGHRLRTLDSTGVGFPSFPQLLLPSRGLVDLRIHEIPTTGYFSPDAFANALSGMTNLRSLSLHFLSLPPRRSYFGFLPQSGERAVLPALTYLKYQGTSNYLDNFVARIDAPRLGDIDITFFCQPTMDASQLGRFIGRTDMQASLIRAEAETSAKAISVSFADASTCTPLRVQISCKRLDWQLSCMAQVCNQFSPFLFRVKELSINTTQWSNEQDDVVGGQWLDLVRSFGGARDFWMANDLATDILRSLGEANGENPTVLPALHYLCVENPMEMNESSWDALLLFITSRSLSSRPVQANVRLSQCYICYVSFRHQKGLDRHLVDEHTCGMCPYCYDLKWKQVYNYIFQEDHLESKHPGPVACVAFLRTVHCALPFPSRLKNCLNLHSSERDRPI
jgi:hypothetical protein